MKYGWDEDVPEEIKRKWSRWLTSIPELQHFKVQRCLKPGGFEDPKIQMHHFADASDSGYGTATYLRLTNGTGEVECNLILSKARVAPIKQVSIPRMELSAATLAVKVDSMLKRELDIQGESIFWSDSQTVIKYIQNETARYPVFVANRIAVIRDGSSPAQWKYVPTEYNPADHASRGLSVSQLLEKPEWLKGPAFLAQPESEWPTVQDKIPTQEEDPETCSAVMANATQVIEDHNPTDSLLQYYSSWHALKKAVAYLLKLKEILKQKVKDKSSTATEPGEELKLKDPQDNTKYNKTCVLTPSEVTKADGTGAK